MSENQLCRKWTDKVTPYLGKEFHFSDDLRTTLATLQDLASHRMGVPDYAAVRLQDKFDRNMLAK